MDVTMKGTVATAFGDCLFMIAYRRKRLRYWRRNRQGMVRDDD